MNRDASLSTLNDLIETAEDGERGFSLAAKDNREPEVAALLKQAEEWCHAVAIELHEQLGLLSAVENGVTAKARVYRGWIDFRAVPISRDTKSILEECERGADYARNRYEAAMEVELPDSVRTVVERHYRLVLAIQDRVRVLRNRYRATEIPSAIGFRSGPGHGA